MARQKGHPVHEAPTTDPGEGLDVRSLYSEAQRLSLGLEPVTNRPHWENRTVAQGHGYMQL